MSKSRAFHLYMARTFLGLMVVLALVGCQQGAAVHAKGASAESIASQTGTAALGSWTWTTSKLPAASSRRMVVIEYGVSAMLDTAPFIGIPTVRPSGIRWSGMGRASGCAPRCSSADSRSGGS